jgi:hypothetical protein
MKFKNINKKMKEMDTDINQIKVQILTLVKVLLEKNIVNKEHLTKEFKKLIAERNTKNAAE